MSERSPADDVQDLISRAGRTLDDPSAEFVVRARDAGVLSDEDWRQVLGWMAEALEFLGRPNDTARTDEDGRLILDMDADPRNADWLRLARAARLAGHHLPLWSAMWLWRIGHERGREYWDHVSRIAEGMGYPRHPDADAEIVRPDAGRRPKGPRRARGRGRTRDQNPGGVI